MTYAEHYTATQKPNNMENVNIGDYVKGNTLGQIFKLVKINGKTSKAQMYKYKLDENNLDNSGYVPFGEVKTIQNKNIKKITSEELLKSFK